MPSKPYTAATAAARKKERLDENQRVKDAIEGSDEDRAKFEEEVRIELETAGFPPLMSRTLLELMSAKKMKWGFCPDCRKRVQVDMPDTGSVHKALEMAMGYLVGKPKERREVELSGVVALKPVHEMTDAELDQMASGHQPLPVAGQPPPRRVSG